MGRKQKRELKKVISPIYITLPRKTKKDKNISLNLNWYRNVNFIMNNQVKKLYKEIITPQIEGLVIDGQFSIKYTLYYKRKSDLMNRISVVDKYFCDALTENGCIVDDNVDYLVGIVGSVGGQDKENPRIEIEIIKNP